jgi:hypothetical protein
VDLQLRSFALVQPVVQIEVVDDGGPLQVFVVERPVLSSPLSEMLGIRKGLSDLLLKVRRPQNCIVTFYDRMVRRNMFDDGSVIARNGMSPSN